MNTTTINDPANMIHMVVSVLNFAFTFIVMMVGFVYGMKKVGKVQLGSSCLSCCLNSRRDAIPDNWWWKTIWRDNARGRMDNVASVHACTLPLILFNFESNEGDQGHRSDKSNIEIGVLVNTK